MSTHKNRVQMTVSGTPGTGTITLGSASSGYQSLATAYGGNATVDILVVDGTAWEVARDCTYTNSGTTVTRGTFEASSTGSAISLTSAAIVSVIATADRGRTWDAAALNTQVAGTDADTTMAVNTLYTVDMSAWATADRTYTLPATAAVGDMVGIVVTAGDASHELIITAASGDTLNGVSGGTEWSRLFITNETVLMRCIVANATWEVWQDGRIPMQGWIEISTAVTTNAANTYVYATANSGAWTSKRNVGNVVDTATDKITMRRACQATLAVGMRTNTTMSDGEYVNAACELNGGGTGALIVNQFFVLGRSGGGLNGQIIGVGEYTFAAGDYVRHMFRTEAANKGIINIPASMMRVYEVLSR